MFQTCKTNCVDLFHDDFPGNEFIIYQKLQNNKFVMKLTCKNIQKAHRHSNTRGEDMKNDRKSTCV